MVGLSAQVRDLNAEREKRGRPAVEYASVEDALLHQLEQMSELREIASEEMFVDSVELDERLITMMRVQRSVLDSYYDHLAQIRQEREHR